MMRPSYSSGSVPLIMYRKLAPWDRSMRGSTYDAPSLSLLYVATTLDVCTTW